MRRISRESLMMTITIALKVLPKYQKTALDLRGEQIVDAVALEIVNRVMGTPESEAVILRPDLAGSPHAPRAGKWGIDEPHPFPDMPFSPH
jgi:hypothetical protein